MRLFRENSVYRWVPQYFDGLSGKFLVGKRKFIEVDHQRRLLIGSLHWEKQRPYRLVPRGEQFTALWEIQQKIGQVCLDEGLHWRIVIDPYFAEDEKAFGWLWYRDEQAAAPAPAPPPMPKCAPPLVGKVPYHLTRALFPFAHWLDPNKPAMHNLGGGDYLFAEAISQPRLDQFGAPEMAPDGNPVTYKRLPWGVMPHHILLTLFNLHLATKSRLITFYDARELIEAFGYVYGHDTRQRIAETLWDMFYCKLTLTNPSDPRGFDVSPFSGLRLWGDTPARRDTLGRRNSGRTTRLGEQKNLYASAIYLNHGFLRWARDQRLADVDWWLSEKLKTKPQQWRFYLKAVELGRRKHADYIPLGGPNGLLQEFGFNTDDSQKYRLAKSRFKKIVAAVVDLTRDRYGEAFACPHHVMRGKDMLKFYPWEPLDGYASDKPLSIPSATRELLTLKCGPELWENYRDQAMELKRAQMRLSRESLALTGEPVLATQGTGTC